MNLSEIFAIDLKSLIKFTCCLFIGFTLGLIYFNTYFKQEIIIQDNSNANSNSPKAAYENETAKDRLLYDNFGFYPVNDQGIYSFWNVCIEYAGHYKETSHKGYRYNETQRISVYNSFYRVGDQSLNVATSYNAGINTWDVIFFRRPIPATHKFHKVTAFFIIPTCPSNFHHFWIDQFVPLFNVVQRGNRLKPNSDNRIFYHLPISENKDIFPADCYNVSRYKKFLDTLYLGSEPSVFFKAPTNSCYSSAVFGSNTAHFTKPRSIIDHVRHYFLTHSPQYRDLLKNKACLVVLLDREYRKIINIDKLVSVAESMGFGGVCKVAFERLSFEEQLSMATKAHVMVGVQGAGLQWAIFMPRQSALIEVAWPHKHWDFFFANYVQPYGIRHIRLIAHHVMVNWSSYETKVRKGVRVGVQERMDKLSGSGVESSFDNVWKWADVMVDVDSFKDVLSSFI